MKRIINYKSIGETASYILLQEEILRDLKDRLLIDIEKITDSYKGIDGEKIKLKYNIKVKLIEEYLNVITTYRKYFEWLSGKYRDADEKIINDLNDIFLNPIPIENETGNIFGINSEDEVSSIWVI